MPPQSSSTQATIFPSVPGSIESSLDIYKLKKYIFDMKYYLFIRIISPLPWPFQILGRRS